MRHVLILMLLVFPCIGWSQEQETQAGRSKAGGIFKDYTAGKFTDVSKGLEEYRARYGENSIYYFLNHLYTKESASPAFSLEVSYKNAVTSLGGYNKIDPKDSEALCKKIGFCLENLKQGIDDLHLRLFIKMRESEEGLTRLIDNYPESPYRIKARSMRDSIRYRAAVAGDTPEAYKFFIANNAGAVQLKEAEFRQAALTWSRVMSSGTAADLGAFLWDFKSAPEYMREAVQKKMRDLKYSQIQKDYKAFMKKYEPLWIALPVIESGGKVDFSGSMVFKGDKIEGAVLKLGTETYKPYMDIKPLINLIAEYSGNANVMESIHLEDLSRDLFKLVERVDFIVVDRLQPDKRGYSAFLEKYPYSSMGLAATFRLKIIEEEERIQSEEKRKKEEEEKRLAEIARQEELARQPAPLLSAVYQSNDDPSPGVHLYAMFNAKGVYIFSTGSSPTVLTNPKNWMKSGSYRIEGTTIIFDDGRKWTVSGNSINANTFSLFKLQDLSSSSSSGGLGSSRNPEPEPYHTCNYCRKGFYGKGYYMAGTRNGIEILRSNDDNLELCCSAYCARKIME